MPYIILHIPTATYLYENFRGFWEIAEYQSSEDAAIGLSYSLYNWAWGTLYLEEETKLFDKYGCLTLQQRKNLYKIPYVESEFEVISV